MIRTAKQRDLLAILRALPPHQRRASLGLLRDGHDPFFAITVPDMVDSALAEIADYGDRHAHS